MRRNREGQLVTLASGFPEPSPLSLQTPCYLAFPISFRCFCQTQASVSPASASLPPLVLSQSAAGRGQRAWASHPSPPRAPSLALLLGNTPRPAPAAAPTAALYQFRTRGSPATLGPPRSVPISVGKPNQGRPQSVSVSFSAEKRSGLRLLGNDAGKHTFPVGFRRRETSSPGFRFCGVGGAGGLEETSNPTLLVLSGTALVFSRASPFCPS